MLQARSLHFQRGHRAILSGVDLQIEGGEILALLGANGAGKTTLLRCLLGLLTPSHGSVHVHGRPLTELSTAQQAQHLAYVPQAHSAPFPYTVREVVNLGRLPHHGPFRGPSADDRDAVERAIAQMGIQALAGRVYTEISGGERQLTLIARAIAQGARVLVMDEPVSGLDFGHQLRLLDRLERLAADGYAILKTTHHPDHALACATRVALLVDGHIEADGAPEDVLSPAAMRRLYHVDVELIHSHSGRAAFVPAS